MRLIGGAVGLKETLQSLDGGDTPTHAMHIQQIQSKASDWSKVTNALHSLNNEILINTGIKQQAKMFLAEKQEQHAI